MNYENQCLKFTATTIRSVQRATGLTDTKVSEGIKEVKGKAVTLQAWIGPEGSRKLRFPDFVTTAQDDGKVVSLTHRPPLHPGNKQIAESSGSKKLRKSDIRAGSHISRK
jgi:hypothetical protein